jgi:hypothetical protein
MAILQQRRCDLCGGEVPMGDVMGTLFLPPGSPAEIRDRIQKELEQLGPVALFDPHEVQRIHQKHQRGLQWDVCKPCVESLTKWSGSNMVKWAAMNFHRAPERSE